jgi:hypothetical protein
VVPVYLELQHQQFNRIRRLAEHLEHLRGHGVVAVVVVGDAEERVDVLWRTQLAPRRNGLLDLALDECFELFLVEVGHLELRESRRIVSP